MTAGALLPLAALAVVPAGPCDRIHDGARPRSAPRFRTRPPSCRSRSPRRGCTRAPRGGRAAARARAIRASGVRWPAARCSAPSSRCRHRQAGIHRLCAGARLRRARAARSTCSTTGKRTAGRSATSAGARSSPARPPPTRWKSAATSPTSPGPRFPAATSPTACAACLRSMRSSPAADAGSRARNRGSARWSRSRCPPRTRPTRASPRRSRRSRMCTAR